MDLPWRATKKAWANAPRSELAVDGCRRNHRHSALCGQAPSAYPDMAQYLVEVGIDSMSPNPDAVLKTTQQLQDPGQSLWRDNITRGLLTSGKRGR